MQTESWINHGAEWRPLPCEIMHWAWGLCMAAGGGAVALAAQLHASRYLWHDLTHTPLLTVPCPPTPPHPTLWKRMAAVEPSHDACVHGVNWRSWTRET